MASVYVTVEGRRGTMGTPSGKDLNVTSGDITGLSGKVDKFQLELGQRITSLHGVVDRIENGWKGSASGAYNTTQAEVNKQLRNVQRDLENLQNLLKMSADGFDEQEQERLRSFTSMPDPAPGNSSAILSI
ncbi:WXG100 family type VII secretion target [Streptomyces sp. NPDC020681]|uniref:WXG100 family type VII secretion target n=1 Tax=Streptomyces sp. NPDC020681 TaxID=3365083 RepID=UPI0037A04585